MRSHPALPRSLTFGVAGVERSEPPVSRASDRGLAALDPSHPDRESSRFNAIPYQAFGARGLDRRIRAASLPVAGPSRSIRASIRPTARV
ncbi:hypothetical protein ElP_27350 [Tautonia plasticadhaerens]|uniref:Uncharacterized protein n=1 Tax=Tautonia plasticadhaerens TaxID=2527974 RepID=A0A518H1W0_9BACT|nr:hypothetical protein ElP_27350 [Tautonia plasticadhaerens]